MGCINAEIVNFQSPCRNATVCCRLPLGTLRVATNKILLYLPLTPLDHFSQTKETKTIYWFWLKGPLDRYWTEVLESITTLSRLSLFSGEELEMVASTKIIFESPHIDNVSIFFSFRSFVNANVVGPVIDVIKLFLEEFWKI